VRELVSPCFWSALRRSGSRIGIWTETRTIRLACAFQSKKRSVRSKANNHGVLNLQERQFGSESLGDMPPDTLIDTGGILALLDRRDRWHQACTVAFQQIRLPAISSEAVLTELFHLVGDNRRDVQAAWKFVRSGALTVSPILDQDFAELNDLMARYHDRPMDFADATLVHIAKRHALTQILTVDHDDFETYRIDGRRRFRIVPGRIAVLR
jgi:uncharacterized protein